MYNISLFCKSFKTDLKRVLRLVESIDAFNVEQIPLYISVPSEDLNLFKSFISSKSTHVISDEEILSANKKISLDIIINTPGNVVQQIVKSEFWRLGFSESYLCLDSDSIFIRPFTTATFLAECGTPYTTITEGHDILFESILNRKSAVISNFFQEAHSLQSIFKRSGKAYSFGPMPLVWHRKVWQSLDSNYLTPRNLTLVDAIKNAPLESRWYGEALLKYKSIPLIPTEPLFKVYHYAWQLDHDIRNNIGLEQLKQLYSGVIYQSSWERNMDWPTEGGSTFSKMARRIRRVLGRT
jgi:hypothetical protein